MHVSIPLAAAIGAALLYLFAALRTARLPPSVRSVILPLALALHAGALAAILFADGTLLIGIGGAFSLFSWQAALLLWLICLREPLQALGWALYPLAAAGALAGAMFPAEVNAVPVSDWRAQVHVLLSLFSAGLLTLAAAQALFLAAQDRLLHRGQLKGFLLNLPPLQTMERALFQLIGWGFALLSMTLLSGIWFLHDWLGQHLVHKVVLSLTAWMVFGVLLWGRARHGWRGRRAINGTLGGYLLLVLAYFGSKLILEEILGRHWT